MECEIAGLEALRKSEMLELVIAKLCLMPSFLGYVVIIRYKPSKSLYYLSSARVVEGEKDVAY